MPQNQNELTTAIVTIIRNQGDPMNAALAARTAIDEVLSSLHTNQNSCTSNRCVATCQRPSFNEMRTIKKIDAPGFTDESLMFSVHHTSVGDVIKVRGRNEFRSMEQDFVVEPRGMVLDRDSIQGQLRLGVLKITGRTYKRSTPYELMDLSSRTYRPVMRPNR